MLNKQDFISGRSPNHRIPAPRKSNILNINVDYDESGEQLDVTTASSARPSSLVLKWAPGDDPITKADYRLLTIGSLLYGPLSGPYVREPATWLRASASSMWPGKRSPGMQSDATPVLLARLRPRLLLSWRRTSAPYACARRGPAGKGLLRKASHPCELSAKPPPARRRTGARLRAGTHARW